ncbi:MAG: orotidine-5'-phosphate decarboxylase [Myxococcota bacterium]|nr:orotidine-5'-phosphate decarboxylase [Myxococcota bacterium]
MSSFPERLAQSVAEHGPLMVGIDPHLNRLPEPFRQSFESLTGASRRTAAAQAVLEWSLQVIEAVAGEVAVVKPQAAFFEQLGSPGWAALEATCRAAREAGLLVVLDAKRGDIGSTAAAYAKALVDDDGPVAADALTLSPYLGPESLTPFVEYCRNQNKGAFILLRTSNPGSEALQGQGSTGAAVDIAQWLEGWNQELKGPSGYGPIGAVVGATLSTEELHHWRKACPHTWLLVPGVGAQGATPADTRPCFREDGLGALINVSRAVTFTSPDEPPSTNPVQAIRSRVRALKAQF